VTQQVWLPADAALLKKLRQDAGIEITTLAKDHSLSVSQVQQLEDGGDHNFYTPAIKLATGRKLLIYFGADVQHVEPALDQNQLPAREVHTTEKKQKVSTNITRRIDLEKPKKNSRSFKILSWGMLAVVVGGFSFYLSTARVGVQSVITHTETELPKRIVSTPDPFKTAEPPAPLPKQTTMDASKESPPACQWSAQAESLVVHHPIKSGDYVHLVANIDSSICVKDATSKLQVFMLKNSQSQTVRGQAPFEIFSHNLHAFTIFYQGGLVRLPSDSIKNITLNAQPYD